MDGRGPVDASAGARRGAGGRGWRRRGPLAAARVAAGRGAFNVNQFYRDEGVLALFDRGANADLSAGGSDLTWQTQRVDGGTVFVQSGGSRR